MLLDTADCAPSVMAPVAFSGFFQFLEKSGKAGGCSHAQPRFDPGGSHAGVAPDQPGEGTEHSVIGNPVGRLRHADVAAAQRKARAATKLRENLMRRKQQQRSRRQGEADETEGLPAAKSPDRDD